jgi:hypothetical protein
LSPCSQPAVRPEKTPAGKRREIAPSWSSGLGVSFANLYTPRSTRCQLRPSNWRGLKPASLASSSVKSLDLSSTGMNGCRGTSRRLVHPALQYNSASEAQNPHSARKPPNSLHERWETRGVPLQVGGRPGTRTRMGYPTRPSNVRVYQFRQPPGCSRMILRGTAHWYPRQDSNSQPPDPKSGALSIELRGRQIEFKLRA